MPPIRVCLILCLLCSASLATWAQAPAYPAYLTYGQVNGPFPLTDTLSLRQGWAQRGTFGGVLSAGRWADFIVIRSMLASADRPVWLLETPARAQERGQLWPGFTPDLVSYEDRRAWLYSRTYLWRPTPLGPDGQVGHVSDSTRVSTHTGQWLPPRGGVIRLSRDSRRPASDRPWAEWARDLAADYEYFQATRVGVHWHLAARDFVSGNLTEGPRLGAGAYWQVTDDFFPHAAIGIGLDDGILKYTLEGVITIEDRTRLVLGIDRSLHGLDQHQTGQQLTLHQTETLRFLQQTLMTYRQRMQAQIHHTPDRWWHIEGHIEAGQMTPEPGTPSRGYGQVEGLVNLNPAGVWLWSGPFVYHHRLRIPQLTARVRTGAQAGWGSFLYGQAQAQWGGVIAGPLHATADLSFGAHVGAPGPLFTPTAPGSNDGFNIWYGGCFESLPFNTLYASRHAHLFTVIGLRRFRVSREVPFRPTLQLALNGGLGWGRQGSTISYPLAGDQQRFRVLRGYGEGLGEAGLMLRDFFEINLEAVTVSMGVGGYLGRFPLDAGDRYRTTSSIKLLINLRS